LTKFYNSKIDYGLTTVSYPKFKEMQFKKNNIEKNKLVDYLIASSTVYPFFKLKKIDNNNYIDGGFKNPVPIDLAKKLGAEKLIIVNNSVFKSKLKIKENENIILIKPNNKMCFPLKFDSLVAKKNINYGYNDTMKKFNKLYGKKYTFKDLNSSNKTYNIDTLEFLGKIYQIDDSKVYDINEYNQLLCDNMFSKNIINYFYKLIKNNQKNFLKRIFPKYYNAAYYLYMINN